MVFQKKVLRSTKLNKEQTQETVMFYKQKGNLSRRDLKDLVTAIGGKGSKEKKRFGIKLIRVLNGGDWHTWTSENDMDEYYRGKVKDDSKFFDFSQAQITYYYE